MKNQNRIFYYDFLRAFAIIAVIICHVEIFYGSTPSSIQTLMKLTIHDIGRLGVPIFLMISGALLLKKTYSLEDFLKRRFSRIIYPYIFWVALIVLGIFFIQHDTKLVIDVITGEFSVTWYFWTLIGIYLTLPVIKSFINEYGESAIKYFLIIWLFTIVLKTINSYPLFSHFTLDLFAGYMGFPVLGYYLDNKKFNLDDNKLLIVLGILFIISLVVCGYNEYITPNVYILLYQNIPMVIISSVFYLLIKTIDNMAAFDRILGNLFGKIIISISVCSYGMYFSHVIVLKALSFINPRSDLLLPVMAILLIGLSWIAVLVVSKIPYLKRFSGT